jgi:glycosyltransferase involved in cell wall biosynthesis
MTIHAAVDNDIHPARFGGAQRSFGLARGMARRARVRVLCVVPNQSTAAPHESVAGVELLRVKAWHTSLAWRLERYGLAPLFTANRGHDRRRRFYEAALGEGADVLAADLHLAALLRGKHPRGARLRVHTSHNVEYDRFRSSAPPVLMRGLWANRMRALEARAVESADLTVVCTDEDAARMRELYGVDASRLAVIANGFDETELRAAQPEQRAAARAALGIADDEHVAVFMGADWGPNRDALRLLTDRVFPSLAGERMRLLVVGSVARSLGSRREPWLIAHGETSELLRVLHAADSGLNPVLAGGGSNVKVPSYLAAGLAVITTPFGIRGYAPLAPHCVVAEPALFADALRARPQGYAVRGVAPPSDLAQYAWGALGERLALHMERMLAASNSKGAA